MDQFPFILKKRKTDWRTREPEKSTSEARAGINFPECEIGHSRFPQLKQLMRMFNRLRSDPMNQASFSLKALLPARTDSEPKPQRAGYFKVLLAMLHNSRRMQAKRILKQHG